jgi:hypothetical protein
MASLAESEDNGAQRGIGKPRICRSADATRIATALVIGTEESIFCSHVEWPFHDSSTFLAHNKILVILIVNIFTLITFALGLLKPLCYTPLRFPGEVGRFGSM